MLQYLISAYGILFLFIFYKNLTFIDLEAYYEDCSPARTVRGISARQRCRQTQATCSAVRCAGQTRPTVRTVAPKAEQWRMFDYRQVPAMVIVPRIRQHLC